MSADRSFNADAVRAQRAAIQAYRQAMFARTERGYQQTEADQELMRTSGYLYDLLLAIEDPTGKRLNENTTFWIEATDSKMCEACLHLGHTTEATLTGTRKVTCSECGGIGRLPYTLPERCPDCSEIGERKGHMTCQYPQD